MKPAYLYCFTGARLAAMQDITGWAPQKVADAVDAQITMGRRGVASTCGRFACAWCRGDLGPAPDLGAGLISHGICQGCKGIALAELEVKNEK